jgi:hypothetical protein
VLEDVGIDTAPPLIEKPLFRGPSLNLIDREVISGRIFPMQQGGHKPNLVGDPDFRPFFCSHVETHYLLYWYLRIYYVFASVGQGL